MRAQRRLPGAACSGSRYLQLRHLLRANLRPCGIVSASRGQRDVGPPSRGRAAQRASRAAHEPRGAAHTVRGTPHRIRSYELVLPVHYAREKCPSGALCGLSRVRAARTHQVTGPDQRARPCRRTAPGSPQFFGSACATLFAGPMATHSCLPGRSAGRRDCPTPASRQQRQPARRRTRDGSTLSEPPVRTPPPQCTTPGARTHAAHIQLHSCVRLRCRRRALAGFASAGAERRGERNGCGKSEFNGHPWNIPGSGSNFVRGDARVPRGRVLRVRHSPGHPAVRVAQVRLQGVRSETVRPEGSHVLAARSLSLTTARRARVRARTVLHTRSAPVGPCPPRCLRAALPPRTSERLCSA